MATAASATPAPAQGLRRELGLASTTSAVIGGIIAVGIFLTPAGMAKALGSPLWLLLVWLVIGAMTLSGALCFGELAGRFPSAGGATSISKSATGGASHSCSDGCACWLWTRPSPPHWPQARGILRLRRSFASTPDQTGRRRRHLGVVSHEHLQCPDECRVFALCHVWLKLGLLGLSDGLGICLPAGSWSNFVPFCGQHPGSLPLAPALAVGVVGAFFSFGGWWDVSKIAGEVRDPGRTLPRALLLGLLAVTLVYIVVSAVFLISSPWKSHFGPDLRGPGRRSFVRAHRRRGVFDHCHHLPGGEVCPHL